MKNKGLILINVLVFAVIAVTVTIALINWATTTLQSTRQLVSREQAFQIAESGVEYYRSYLAEHPADYTGGTHDFKDRDGNTIGQFTLTITPPSATSSVVVIKSKGTISGNSPISRVIQSVLVIPSLARYAVVSNDILHFKTGEEFFGPIHSNNEIRFDGIAHNIVTSSSPHPGVYTTVTGSNVFLAGTKFPVVEVDFDIITDSLSDIEDAAQANNRHYGPSGKEGYHIVLNANDTFTLSKVKNLINVNNPCEQDNPGQSGWGTWSVKNEDSIGTYSFPTDGAIFFDDHVWVDGTINTARLTIGSSQNIIVNKDIIYTNYDGQDAIGLIAQKNINIGIESEDNLRLDAALVTKEGRVGRHYYSTRCSNDGHTRNLITLYGMIATYNHYEFSYDNNTGYKFRNISFDQNLSTNPPPFFPRLSDQYITLSWDEIK